MNINDVYKQLTNVNIEEQKRLWDERGKGYYGEFMVFCELYKKLVGNCKILMNLNIPTTNQNKTTEIDLLLIHETGIYVFEVKHYKGTIYGDDKGQVWTQYFRTVKNETFRNPMLQNEYHINALNYIFNDIPIKSVIVFTNHNCNLKVKNSNQNISLCTFYNMNENLENMFNNSSALLSMEQIDDIFERLSEYSQMKETVLYDGKEKSFNDWLKPILLNLEEEKINYETQTKKNIKTLKVGITVNILIVIFISISILLFINNIKTDYNQNLAVAKENYDTELEKFKQNFKHIDEIDNEYITAINEYFGVSNMSLNILSSNSVTFSATISTKNDTYGMALTENSKYIVMTDNGKVYEYDVFGEKLNYNRYYNEIGKGIRESGNLAKTQFYGVSKNEIDYIKITNIELFKLDINKTRIKGELELELYSK